MASSADDRWSWVALLVGLFFTGGAAIPWIVAQRPPDIAQSPSSLRAATAATQNSHSDAPSWDKRLKGAQVLIVTMPDPRDSRLDFLFDSQLTAVQAAVSQAGWTFDSFQFPWPLESPLTASAKASSTEVGLDPYALRLTWGKHAKEAPLHHREPGLLLYRNDDAISARFLAVLLVGETPTSGVHLDAFRRALDLASANPGPDCDSPIRIVGPSFTGGAFSVRSGLEAWWELNPAKRGRNFILMSGSATGIERGYFEAADGPSIDFFTTQWNVHTVNAAIERRLATYGITTYAVLSEAETKYGSGTRAAPTWRHAAQGLSPNYYIYPLYISLLGAQYDQERRQVLDKFEPPGQIQGGSIRIPFLSDPNGKDLPPLYNFGMASVNMDLVLHEQLSAMASHRYEYVVINATDPRDAVFLAERVKAYLPNTQLIITSVALLANHREYDAALRGALMPAAYPLGASARNRGIAFATQDNYGVFNAVLLQLGCPEKLLDYPAADGPKRSPAPSGIWWLQVGRQGIWRLGRDEDVVCEAESHETIYPFVRPSPQASRVPSSLHTPPLFLTMSFAVLLGSAGALFQWHRHGADQVSRVKSAPPTALSMGESRWFLGAVLLCMAVTCGMHLYMASLIGVPLRAGLADRFWPQPFVWIVVHLAFHLVLVCFWIVAAFEALTNRKQSAGQTVGIVASLTLISLGLLALFCLRAPYASWSPGLAFDRYTALTAGLSPVWPWMFAALFALLVVQTYILDVVLRALHRIPPPLPPPTQRAFDAFQLALVVTAVALPMWYLSERIWLSELPWPYVALAQAFYLAAGGALASACYGFYRQWRDLSQTLGLAQDLEMVAAWRRIPPQLSALVGHIVGGQRPRPRHWEVVFSLWKRCRCAEPWDPGRPRSVYRRKKYAGKAMRKCQQALAEKTDDSPRDEPPERRFAELFAQVRSDLHEWWQCVPSGVTFATLEPQPKPEDIAWGAAWPTIQHLHNVEDFFAAVIVLHLSQALCRLRAWFWCLAFGALLLVLFVASYPFGGQRGMLYGALSIAAAVLALGSYVLLQLNKDPVVSWICGTQPGQVTFDRHLCMAVLGLVPLVVVVLHLLTGAFEPVLAWLAPLVGGR